MPESGLDCLICAVFARQRKAPTRSASRSRRATHMQLEPLWNWSHWPLFYVRGGSPWPKFEGESSIPHWNEDLLETFRSEGLARSTSLSRGVTRSLSLSLALSVSLSLTHTHTHKHTHTHTHTHRERLTHTLSLSLSLSLARALSLSL